MLREHHAPLPVPQAPPPLPLVAGAAALEPQRALPLPPPVAHLALVLRALRPRELPHALEPPGVSCPGLPRLAGEREGGWGGRGVASTSGARRGGAGRGGGRDSARQRPGAGRMGRGRGRGKGGMRFGRVGPLTSGAFASNSPTYCTPSAQA